jgi:hypothetical protein
MSSALPQEADSFGVEPHFRVRPSRLMHRSKGIPHRAKSDGLIGNTLISECFHFDPFNVVFFSAGLLQIV